MPQAPASLGAEFDSDATAFGVLRGRFGVSRGGLIYPRPGVVPTPEDWRAIDYLILEWDYGYTINPKREILSDDEE